MSKTCSITGKKVLFGNNVSHSNRKTRRKFSSNLHSYKFWNEEKNCFIKLVLSAKGLRIINKIGIEEALKRIKKKII